MMPREWSDHVLVMVETCPVTHRTEHDRRTYLKQWIAKAVRDSVRAEREECAAMCDAEAEFFVDHPEVTDAHKARADTARDLAYQIRHRGGP